MNYFTIQVTGDTGILKTTSGLFILAIIFILQISSQVGQCETSEFSVPEKIDLNFCLQVARENNPELAAAKRQLAASEEAIKVARSQFFPSVEANSTYTRSYAEDFGEFDSYGNRLSFTQPIFHGLSIWERYKQAKAEREVAYQDYTKTFLDVIQAVKNNFYQTLAQKHLIKVDEENLKSAAYHLKLSEARFHVGLANRADVLKAKVEKAQAKVDLIRVRNAYLQAMARLNKSMGITVIRHHELLDLFNELLDPKSVDLLESIEVANKYRPAMRKIVAEIEKQKTLIKQAQSDFLPQVNFKGDYGWQGERFSSQKRNWDLGVTMDISLFSGLGTVASVSENRKLLEELQKRKIELSYEIELDVYSSFLNLNESFEEVSATQILLASAQENLNVIEGLYKQGLANFIDVIDAQASLTSAKTQNIQAIYNHHINTTNLWRATGRDLEDIIPESQISAQ